MTYAALSRSRRIFQLSSLDVRRAVERQSLREENAALRERVALLEGCLGIAPGEQIAPLRKPRRFRLFASRSSRAR